MSFMIHAANHRELAQQHLKHIPANRNTAIIVAVTLENCYVVRAHGPGRTVPKHTFMVAATSDQQTILLPTCILKQLLSRKDAEKFNFLRCCF